MYSDIIPVKVSDDGTVWIKGKSWAELIEFLKRDFVKIMKWACKWQLKFSMLKTEFCLFSIDNKVLDEVRAFRFCIDGQELKYNPTPKILGVTLDEKLKFETHIELVEQKALRSLDLLRRFKKTELINTKCNQYQLETVVAWTEFKQGSHRTWKTGKTREFQNPGSRSEEYQEIVKMSHIRELSWKIVKSGVH